MGKVIIQPETTTNPISLIGKEAGLCWGADTEDQEKNFKRGLECIQNNHGRTMEFPQVYITIDGYSAKVVRELYTHIAGGPTRLQASTRYIDYKNFNFVVPPSMMWDTNSEACQIYFNCMEEIQKSVAKLEEIGIPREDATMLLPLGMETKMVLRTNLRHLYDMAGVRMCSRAYWEFRGLFFDILNTLGSYSEEWDYLIKKEKIFMPRCERLGYCPEKYGCGRKSKKEI